MSIDEAIAIIENELEIMNQDRERRGEEWEDCWDEDLYIAQQIIITAIKSLRK